MCIKPWEAAVGIGEAVVGIEEAAVGIGETAVGIEGWRTAFWGDGALGLFMTRKLTI
ncbi:hypothetical protein GCM10008915_31870 [Bifidobacterium pullorum subsp. gallinarum]